MKSSNKLACKMLVLYFSEKKVVNADIITEATVDLMSTSLFPGATVKDMVEVSVIVMASV